jgi:hypothetical protein
MFINYHSCYTGYYQSLNNDGFVVEIQFAAYILIWDALNKLTNCPRISPKCEFQLDLPSSLIFLVFISFYIWNIYFLVVWRTCIGLSPRTNGNAFWCIFNIHLKRRIVYQFGQEQGFILIWNSFISSCYIYVCVRDCVCVCVCVEKDVKLQE